MAMLALGAGWMRRTVWTVVVLLTLLFGGAARAQTPDPALYRGYVRAVDDRTGRVGVARPGHKEPLPVRSGMPLYAGDTIYALDGARIIIVSHEGLLTLEPGNTRKEFPAVSGVATTRNEGLLLRLSRLMEAMPRSQPIADRGSGTRCEVQRGPAEPLRPVAALRSREAWVPEDHLAVAIAWVGGRRPYTVSARSADGRTSTELVFCDPGRAIMRWSATTRPASIELTDIDGSTMSWTLRADAARPAAFAPPGVRSDDEQAAMLADVLLTGDPNLSLMAFTRLVDLGGRNLIAWRLAIAVQDQELNQ